MSAASGESPQAVAFMLMQQILLATGHGSGSTVWPANVAADKGKALSEAEILALYGRCLKATTS